MNNNLYYDMSEQKNKITKAVKDTFREYMAYIVLLFNIVVNVLSKMYQIGWQNPFTIEYFLDLAINVTTTMLCYACFIPIGTQNEKTINDSYRKNLDSWGNLSHKIRTDFMQMFENFCVEQVEYERQERRRVIIGNKSTIPYDVYFSEYSKLEKEEIKALYKSGKITKTQKKAILTANGIKVKPVSASLVLSGTKYDNINDAGRKSMSSSNAFLIRKPFLIIASNIILNVIKSIPRELNIREFLFDVAISILLIVTASVVGYSVGVTAIRDRNDKIKCKVLFLSKFIEKEHISI